jgi:DNA-binding GntR family transcriptional regulator
MTSVVARQAFVAIRKYDRTVTAELLAQDPTTGLSMADRAYTVIKDRLIMLDIRPNDPIDDGALAQELGIGRTPVREALKRLETDRLVVAYPRRGTFATGVDIADLAGISEIRAQLEPLAARRAAERASRATRVELTDLASATASLDIGTLDRTELMRWDQRVHRAIYRATDNAHLEDVLVRYDDLATRIFCLFLDRLQHVDQHVGEHAELLRTIADGEVDRAEELAREHVLGFERAVRAAI